MSTHPACPVAWSVLGKPAPYPQQFKKEEEERGDCWKRRQKEKGDGSDKVAEISTESRENEAHYCPFF